RCAFTRGEGGNCPAEWELRRLEARGQIGRTFGTLRGLWQRIPDDLFEFLQVGHEARAPLGGQAIERLRPPAVGAAPGLDQAGVLQHVDMTTQVAVGERAEALQVVE